MKKRIKTNCNYTLKPESHSFLGEKGKQIIFSGSGYAECEGTNGIIVNENKYYNTDSPEFANNTFGVGSAMNKRLRCNSFSFQIRNKNLYGAGLLNNLRCDDGDWIPTTLEADPATGAVHWVAPDYDGDGGTIDLITFFDSADPPKTFHLGNTNKVYFSCFAKGLKYNGNIGMSLGYNNVYTDDMFFSLENNNTIMNEPITGIVNGNLILQSLKLVSYYVANNSNFDNSQDVWFYPVISTEPITEEFFENYVGFVPFPAYGETYVYPETGDNKQIYALPYTFNTPFFINNYNCELCEEFVDELFKNYGYRERFYYGADNNKAVPWGSLQTPSENYDFQWVWNSLNTGIMGNDWEGYPIEESFTPLSLLYKPLFLLGYHNGGLSLITTGEKIPTYAQDNEQYIRPVIQTLVFVNYESETPDYISPVYTIVYPTLVNVD